MRRVALFPEMVNDWWGNLCDRLVEAKEQKDSANFKKWGARCSPHIRRLQIFWQSIKQSSSIEEKLGTFHTINDYKKAVTSTRGERWKRRLIIVNFEKWRGKTFRDWKSVESDSLKTYTWNDSHYAWNFMKRYQSNPSLNHHQQHTGYAEIHWRQSA